MAARRRSCGADPASSPGLRHGASPRRPKPGRQLPRNGKRWCSWRPNGSCRFRMATGQLATQSFSLRKNVMDRLEELAVLAAVLEGGSLAAAARRLRRSPPAITRAIASLEQRVGARLIERTTRRLAPTAAGQALGNRARLLLDGYEAAMQAPMEAALRGTLRITAPVVFGRRHVTPCVLAFQAAHPDVQVELVLADRNLDLVDEGLDVAVRIGHLAESSLIARRIGTVRRQLVASPAYLAEHGTPRMPAELAGHVVIAAISRDAPLEWRFREGDRDRIVRLTPWLMVNDVEAMLLAARSG